jgi:glycosyltransferase involved in cell wall biosynthesis
MTLGFRHPMRITWLCPDDRGGGVISVAQACCRQAAEAGHKVTLLLGLSPTGHAAEFGGFPLESLQAPPPYTDIPVRLAHWLRDNPQDILLLNGCEEADFAIPYIASNTRVVYVVHDTADRYFAAALRNERQLDAIIAVSESVAARFRQRLNNPAKLSVAWNGTVLPLTIDLVLKARRGDDLIFLGGDNPLKGAYDVLELWNILVLSEYDGRLHWFGDLSETFRARIASLPRASRIAVYGRQPRRAVFDAASHAKIILMLSRVEPFGMATVECMGMGCIPVAWDIETGTKEIVSKGEGIFAPLGDYVALAQAVSAALDIHSKCFAQVAARIRRDFSEEAMWRRYVFILVELMARAPAVRPLAERIPPAYRRPLRLYQFVPAGLREKIRIAVGKSPRLGYILRDFRGR